MCNLFSSKSVHRRNHRVVGNCRYAGSNKMAYVEIDLSLENDDDSENYDTDIIPSMRPKHSMNE